MIWLLCLIGIMFVSFSFSNLPLKFYFDLHMKNKELYILISFKKRCLYQKRLILSEDELKKILTLKKDKECAILTSLRHKKVGNKPTSIVSSVMKYSNVIFLKWETQIGIGEADYTAILTGGLWMGKTSVVNGLEKKGVLACHPKLRIQPCFNTYYFETKMHCILSIKLRHTIYCIFKFKSLKEGRKIK